MAVSTKRKNYKAYYKYYKAHFQLKQMIELGLFVIKPAQDVDLKSLQSTLQEQHYGLVADILGTKVQGGQHGQ